MAKRRFQNQTDGTKAPEQLSPEERRVRRREDRERDARGKKPKDARTGWRRAVVPLAVVGTIAVVVVIILWGVGVLFHPPCVQFGPIPSSSGTPQFPNATTTDFTGTWCPTATALFSINPQLSIVINGATIALPPSIGRSANFTGHACVLPLHTQPGLSLGLFNVSSPWAYQYTLGEFFTVWQGSYQSAFVNSSYSTRTIDYTASSILGLPADAHHSLTLFVDNQQSSDGPGLILNTLNHGPGSSPSCIDTIYGSGHTITIVYKSTTTGTAIPVPGTLSTASAAPLAPTFDSPLAVGPSVVSSAHPGSAVPPWLLLRPAP
ncbi:MAG: hypothetical protein L3J73_03460 [Thermoplasmata archaeon]|nr:hypothetical protein [Thermoplasmata archaeon]